MNSKFSLSGIFSPSLLCVLLLFGFSSNVIIAQDLPASVTQADLIAKIQWKDDQWQTKTLKRKEGFKGDSEKRILELGKKQGDMRRKAGIKSTVFYMIYSGEGQAKTSWEVITLNRGKIRLYDHGKALDFEEKDFDSRISP